MDPGLDKDLSFLSLVEAHIDLMLTFVILS
ncbi:hypothetical protein BJ992_006401 [Sphaerisporangium rubeum]|uniref:Uncharacterized protein n=1 Tax=Sphaerisporangium rubeum TaxID=321317 RepID=A0A7X0IKP1_9ACTN|nr:hypothetical protein [Sphaerisporangium rubeum]